MKQLNRQDVLLVVLSGHGLQMLTTRDGKAAEDSFFCPVDTIKSDSGTMLSISELMQRVSANSGSENNLLVVDACRDNPAKGAKSLDGSLVTGLPVNMAILFGSSAGTRSYESDKLKSGLLGHYFLEGLRGAARDPEGEVTWGTLVNYVKKNVSRNSVELVGVPQRPNDISNLQGEPPLLAKVVLPGPTPNRPTVPFPPPPGSSSGKRDASRAGEEREDNGLQLKLVWCPPGQFQMGSPPSETGRDDDETQVPVTLSRGFWLGKYEVTQGEFSRVMGTSPWSGETYVKEGPRYAASYVSHDVAVEFCRKLTEQERAANRLGAEERYRLPTEAEWEYACRAGTKTRYSFGDDESKLSDYGWWGGILGDGNAKTEQYAHMVGQKQPNAFGLHDMHGNVWEWCSDWKGATPAGGSDPTRPASGSYRVFRGGGWYDFAARCRSAYRSFDSPGCRNSFLGFRLARSSGS